VEEKEFYMELGVSYSATWKGKKVRVYGHNEGGAVLESDCATKIPMKELSNIKRIKD